MSVVVFQISSSGAASANDEAKVEATLKDRMKGNGGRRGLWVGYQADQDSNGVFQNFGLVRITADNEAAAQRYRDAGE